MNTEHALISILNIYFLIISTSVAILAILIGIRGNFPPRAAKFILVYSIRALVIIAGLIIIGIIVFLSNISLLESSIQPTVTSSVVESTPTRFLATPTSNLISPEKTPSPMPDLCDGISLPMYPAPNGANYQVKWGQNIPKIAAQFGITEQALIDANKIYYPTLEDHPGCIRGGWWLIIPEKDSKSGI